MLFRSIDIAFDILKAARQRELVTTNASGLVFVKTLAALMNVPLVWNCITTKSNDWEHEQELRMLAMNDLTKPHLQIYHRDNNRPYVVIPIDFGKEGIISEIMVGSDAHAGAEDEVRALLHKLGMSELPPISRILARN